MEDLVQNILKVFNVATESEKLEGVSWYGDANKLCKRLAVKHGLTLEVVCYVCSALSPNNKWQRNVADLQRVLELYTSGELAPRVEKYVAGDKDALKGIACTYTANLVKAFRILETGDVSHIGNGLKTQNFAKNIFHIEDDFITVDFHAISIARNFRYTVETVKGAGFKSKQYNEVANAYREAGARVGLLGKHVQAITWVAWRNLDTRG